MNNSQTLASQSRWQDVILGLFVLVAVGVVVYLAIHQTYFQAQKKDWLTLKATVAETFGLAPGTLVELSGVTIGNVEALVLGRDAAVRLTILIDDQYADFMRLDSVLEVNSQLGVDAMLSGVGLTLVPGEQLELLSDGDSISIQEPKSLDQMMAELKIEELAADAQAIVDHVATITGAVASQQDVLVATLQHVNQLTAALVALTEEMPAVLGSVDATLNALEKTLDGVNQEVLALTAPLEANLASSDELMRTSTATIASLEPALQELPSLMNYSKQVMWSVDRLSRQLAQHWLFGGETIVTQAPVGSLLLPDNSLYGDVDGKE